MRPYSDHEVDHSDEDTHDRSIWTQPDKLDALGMVCELSCLLCGLYFVGLGENPNTDDFMYLVVGTFALIATLVPMVVGTAIGWRAHQAQVAARKHKK